MTSKSRGDCRNVKSTQNYLMVAGLLRRLAGLYFENGELLAAQSTLEDVLDMYRDILPFSDGEDGDAYLLEIAEIICNLGSIELEHKNYELAVARFAESVDIQRGMPPRNVSYVASLDNLGYSLSKCKSCDQALACYREMLDAQLAHYRTFNDRCHETLEKQLLMHEKLGDREGAAKTAKMALESALNLPNVSNARIDALQRLRAQLKAKRWRR